MPLREYSEYSDTARALAGQSDDYDDHDDAFGRQSHSRSPAWTRRSIDSSNTNRRGSSGAGTRWLQRSEKLRRQVTKLWCHLTPLQQGGFVLVSAALSVITILFIIYHQRILHWITPVVVSWRNLRGGWLILWAMTFAVSFPPMIGYSTCVTLAGLVYGMQGWFIVSSATVVGATCSFLVSRTVLRSFVTRLTGKDKRFAALSLVLKHDGLKLLIMIRLCPLPYSISNGAISTIPTVSALNFMIATAVASPKLLLHIFVGSRLGEIAEHGDKMDTKTKIVSYISIVIGVTAGIVTGYFIYVRTRKRAAELEAEEIEGGNDGAVPALRSGGLPTDFLSDSEEDVGRQQNDLRRADEISLHQTYADDLDEDDFESEGRSGSRGAGYQDEFTDNEDAQTQGTKTGRARN